ncbi:MAG: sigma-70 family RNA polymerase sigma factor [Flavobacteriales bacterium]|nr:sigma-70 family RNA polymerase sigma factor [Flavobacteriales bacterium]
MLRISSSLLERCIRKDSSAQFELYTVLRDTLLSVAHRYEKDVLLRKAMVNAAFLKILEHLVNKDPDAPIEAWCRRIMINTVLNEQRNDRRANGQGYGKHVEIADEHAPTAFNGAEEMIQTEELRHMMDRLPTVTRAVFNLYAIDGWKHKEIAATLGISEGTSKWHVSHARQALQEMLGERLRSHLKLRIA